MPNVFKKVSDGTFGINTVIRPFERADLGALTDLVIQTIEVSYQSFYPPHAINFFKHFHSAENIKQRAISGLVLVTVSNEQIVATASLQGAEIFAVFVDPELQGNGCGQELMVALEKEAVQRGVSTIKLDISLPSRKFYEGLGYQIVKEGSKDLGYGQVLKFWRAEKVISR